MRIYHNEIPVDKLVFQQGNVKSDVAEFRFKRNDDFEVNESKIKVSLIVGEDKLTTVSNPKALKFSYTDTSVSVFWNLQTKENETFGEKLVQIKIQNLAEDYTILILLKYM